jgi:hypothetical protein
MHVRVSAQMGVMTETPDSPLLRKPQYRTPQQVHNEYLEQQIAA